MIKILLVGIGRWGANHLRVLNSLPIEFYVADLSPKRLEEAKKLGIPESRLSTDYKQFAGIVDAAVIVTPAQSHFPLCEEFLLAGKDVFVEKPLTLTNDESKGLTERVASTGRILQVGHIFRYDPASTWLKNAIQHGELGRINLLRGHFGGFKRPRNDSGVMFADGIHFVDLFNYFLGTTPVTVQAIHHDFMGRGMEDFSYVSMEYDTAYGKTWATVETDYYIPGKFRDVTVVGDKLTAVCDYNLPENKIKTFENSHVREGNDFKGVEGKITQIETAKEEPLLAELSAFLKSIETRKQPLADVWSGYHSVVVLNAALESLKTNGPVRISK
jgi:UDP-N-acetylglucosamine 3-dehydrogenase